MGDSVWWCVVKCGGVQWRVEGGGWWCLMRVVVCGGMMWCIVDKILTHTRELVNVNSI